MRDAGNHVPSIVHHRSNCSPLKPFEHCVSNALVPVERSSNLCHTHSSLFQGFATDCQVAEPPSCLSNAPVRSLVFLVPFERLARFSHMICPFRAVWLFLECSSLSRAR